MRSIPTVFGSNLHVLLKRKGNQIHPACYAQTRAVQSDGQGRQSGDATIHDDVINCDYNLSSVPLLGKELNRLMWRSTLEDEERAQPSILFCTVCSSAFVSTPPGRDTISSAGICPVAARAGHEGWKEQWLAQRDSLKTFGGAPGLMQVRCPSFRLRCFSWPAGPTVRLVRNKEIIRTYRPQGTTGSDYLD